MGSQSISLQKLNQAAKGNTDLLDVLRSLREVGTIQQATTGTTPTAAPTPGQPNPAAPVPPQAAGVVSLLNGSYIVQLTNPGAQNPISQLQAAQAAGNATPLTSVQPVKPIFHQLRASTSPAFNVNSNTQTFGGNTGSTQTFWTLTGLGTGRWYIQFRSSYDGINFNTWRNANSGTAASVVVNQVTEENIGTSNWALFSLPGSFTAGIGEGFVADGGLFSLATPLYSSGLLAIAGPNGYTPQGNSSYGVTLCDLDVVIPVGPTPAGIPDYPVEVAMEYGVAGSAPAFYAGNATVFGIAFDPTNENVTLYPGPGGASWAVMRLPGGARIAIGQGKDAHGSTLWTPPAISGWFDWSRSVSISSFTDATDVGFTPHGYFTNVVTAGVLSAQYNDESHTWPTTAHWLAVAWEVGAPTLTAGGMTFLKISLQGGHSIIIGAGPVALSASITLPTGYSSGRLLSICTPGGFTPAGHHMQGVARCSMIGLTPILQYQDDSNNIWGGPTNVFLTAWN